VKEPPYLLIKATLTEEEEGTVQLTSINKVACFVKKVKKNIFSIKIS
jgi:hypothetical protein